MILPCTRNWGKHAGTVQQNGGVQKAVERFFQNPALTTCAGLAVLRNDYDDGHDSDDDFREIGPTHGLHLLAIFGLEILLSHFVNEIHGADINARDHWGWTPLLQAVERGHKGIVKLLLDHKADVNAISDGEFTALHWAVMRGHEMVVEELLEHNPVINVRGGDGLTALHRAAMKGQGRSCARQVVRPNLARFSAWF